MSIGQNLAAELKMEYAATRKVIERIPLEKADWKPHARSMGLQQLTGHVAEMPFWSEITCTTEGLDFAVNKYEQYLPTDTGAMLEKFDKEAASALAVLEAISDEDILRPWTMRNGEKVYFTLPRLQVIKGFGINHMIHHRAQLTVYMRLLDIKVPGIYGPSADEM